MTPPKPAWSTSPATGVVIARLFELYARALRVDAALKAKRMTKLVNLIEQDKP